MSTNEKPAALLPGTLVGGYRIVQKLAAGGFGVVYLAESTEGRWVAIKEYLPTRLVTRLPGERVPQVQQDSVAMYRTGLKSFFEEGRSLAQIAHPSVVGVQNFFRENETVYMVMDWLQGASLQEFILIARKHRGKGNLCLQEGAIYSLFDEILQGLRLVHQYKMLHLDIKPANIFICNDDRAVMIDFGAAREVLNKSGPIIRPMYTPGFAAPEMYPRDGTWGPWTDIYAIGASIYACMVGSSPQAAPDRIKEDRIPPALVEVRRHYSQELIDVVIHCLALDPLARPQSVLTVKKALEAASLKSRPNESIKRASWFETLGRWGKNSTAQTPMNPPLT